MAVKVGASSPKEKGGRNSTGGGAPEPRSSVRLRVVDGGGAKTPRPPATTFAMTDTGNAERLAARFGDRVRYVKSWEEHLIYMPDGYWMRDTGGVEIGRLAKETTRKISEEVERTVRLTDKELLKKWKKKSEARGSRAAMIDLLKSEDGIALHHNALDVDHYALNVLNGTVNLKTGELRAHSPEDLITKHIPVAYKRGAKAPRWNAFLREVLPNKEVREFVQRFLGYCLTGDVSERMFCIFLGGGCNGKTALLNAVEAVMGEYATTAAPTLLVAKQQETHPAEIADLFGARLAVSSETRKGATFDEERVKRLTGNDRLKARRMREDYWEFQPTHKLLIASNHKPRVKDATDSFWDRIAIVPFEVRIPRNKVDRKLGVKLAAEREGILLWLVEGCLAWRVNGLKPPKEVMSATESYRTEEDIAGRFLAECCVPDKQAFTRTAHLLAVNEAWAAEEHVYPISPKDLSEKLRAEPFKCQPHKSSGVMGWKGVRLVRKLKK